MIEPKRESELEHTMLLISTRRKAPTGTPSGPRMRAPRRRKIGAEVMSRMVMLVMVTSSSSPPSTVSSASPWQPSNTQLEMVMFLNPPFDSVPNLMRPVRVTLVSGIVRLESAVEQSAELVFSGDVTIGDGDILGGARIAQRERTLGTDGIVPGRIDGAVRDANVAAAVEVNAVAVGVDFQIVDGEVVHAGGQNAEVSALQNGEVAQDDVAAIL